MLLVSICIFEFSWISCLLLSIIHILVVFLSILEKSETLLYIQLYYVKIVRWGMTPPGVTFDIFENVTFCTIVSTNCSLFFLTADDYYHVIYFFLCFPWEILYKKISLVLLQLLLSPIINFEIKLFTYTAKMGESSSVKNKSSN